MVMLVTAMGIGVYAAQSNIDAITIDGAVAVAVVVAGKRIAVIDPP